MKTKHVLSLKREMANAALNRRKKDVDTWLPPVRWIDIEKKRVNENKERRIKRERI